MIKRTETTQRQSKAQIKERSIADTLTNGRQDYLYMMDWLKDDKQDGINMFVKVIWR